MKRLSTRLKWIGFLLIISIMALYSQSKLSPITQIILNGKSSALKSKSLIKSADQPDMLSVFVKVQDESAFSLIYEYGGHIQTIAGNICTATLPLSSVQPLSEQPEILSINSAVEAKPTLDIARVSSNNSLVNAGQAPLLKGYTGNGVVIGMVDTGFDFTHPTFYSDASLSTYRIKYVWNQRATSGTKPIPYNYGAEYTTKAAILAAGKDISNEDHATHTTGIAAGSGYNTVYKGIAPASDIYLVGTDLSTTGIIDGVNYIISKAASEGKPCVINLSLGSQIGPHDGTSDFDQMLAEKVGPGVVVVGAASNEGGDPIHIRTSGSSQVSTVVVPNDYTSSSSYVISDLWSNANHNFQVRISLYNSATGALIKQTPWIGANYSSQINTTNTSYLIQCGYGLNPSNDKTNMAVVVQGTPFVTKETIVISINPLTSNYVDMWASYGTYSNVLTGQSGLVSGDTDYTVGEIGGVANDIISVGAYVTRNQWQAINGNTYKYNPVEPIGAIASFSSKGPTADGRIKPDIAAPGCGVVSSVNHFSSQYRASYPMSLSTSLVNSTTYYWGVMQGTSMASPVVAGSLALWLEAYPNLTQQQVKQILASTAKQNTTTKATYPNNSWGQGVFDSYAGLVNLINTVDIAPADADKSILVYPNPITDNCNIQVSANNKVVRVELRDVSGRSVFAKVFSGNANQELLSLASLPRGIYVMNIQTILGVKSEKVILK